MGFIDRFLNAIKLNDDFDDDEDFLDDEDDLLDDDPDEDLRKTKKRRFFSSFTADDDDDDDFDEDDEPVKKRSERLSGRKAEKKKTSVSRKPAPAASSKSTRTESSARTVGYASRQTAVREDRPVQTDSRKKTQKITPIRKKSSLSNMEVNVIRPSSMEDTRDIADTLLENCTVVLNLEGLDVDIAQRVIDFTCGVCYSLNGNLQKVSSYIFILTPENVELSGDFQSILSGAFDLAPMRSGF